MSSGISTVTCMGIICCAPGRHLAASDVIIAHPDRRGQTPPRAQLRWGIVLLAPAQFPKAKSFLQSAPIIGGAWQPCRYLPLCVNYSPAVRLFHAGRGRRVVLFERPRALYSLHRSCPPMAVAVALNLHPSARSEEHTSELQSLRHLV